MAPTSTLTLGYYIRWDVMKKQKNDVSEIVTSIIEKNPQLFYVEKEYKVSYSEQTDEAISIYFSFKYSDSELGIKVNDFNSRIQLITDEIMKSETDFDKIHSCHASGR